MCLVALTGCLLSGTVAQAQLPTNQLHFAFTDASGTSTPSDTSLNPGAIVTSVNMYNAASGLNLVNLHGAVGSGVANPGVASTIRSLDFSPDIILSQTNQPANSKQVPPFVIAGGSAETGTAPASGSGNAALAADLNDAVLANLGTGGVIGPFVATIWVNLNAAIPPGETVCPRIWILNQSTASAPFGLDTGNAGAPGSLGLKFQQNNQVAFSMGSDNPTLLGTLPSGTFPVNTWMFFAVVYDSTNYFIYYGTPSSSPQQIGKVAGANRTYSMGASGTLVFGNRRTSTTYNTRGLDGWLDDFRLYSGGYGNLPFVQSIWGSAIGNPPVVTSTYPDGTLLLQGTNTFTFSTSSPVGNNITNVTLLMNGVNVSSHLTVVTNGTSGTSSNLSFSYSNLQPNQGNTAVITMQDAAGSISSSTVTFDTYNPTNFIWEAEDFDAINPVNLNPGFFIDNPLYTATNAVDGSGNPTSYYQLDSMEGVDTHKGSGNPATSATDYRVPGALAPGPYKTQTPASGDVNRQKFIDAAVGDPGVVDHIVGNWATAEWQNYTRTFPAGKYNVYGRLSSSAAATITFVQVTSGQGTSSQTTTNIGTFNFNSGGIGTYAYVPLQDALGNLVVVTNLAGVNTVRVTSGGGANANFYMLVPANTNLPSITGVNPSGAVLFQPTNALVFTASSAAGISTNSITVTVNGINVSNLLVFSGSSVSWNVSYPNLKTNQTYAVVIHVTDANGNSASSTLNIDTYAPTFTWEAEDFDFGGGQYIDNPLPTTTPTTAANSYCERVATDGIDAHPSNVPQVSAGDYRETDIIPCTPNFDSSRSLFLTNNAQDYSLGFLANGYWENYTKTFPSGTYNVYGRMANGQNPAAVVAADLITKGWGTTIQFTKRLGTFTVQNTGWSAYNHVPLMDKYGNYANVTLNGTNTIRATELAAANINFYMLTAARTDLPRIDNVYPDGAVLMQGTNKFSFTASSPVNGVATNNIHVTLNGVNISSNLVFSGSLASWNVSYPGLLPNTSYTAVITMTDNVNQAHSPVTVSFDTFSPTNFTWEGEDFDFDPAKSPVNPGSSILRFIDNPVLADASTEATNAYFGQTGDSDIDYSSLFQSVIGTYVYRPSDFVSTEITSDTLRQTYLNAQLAANDPGIVDYDINHLGSGMWIDYTRTFPSGYFYLYARLSAASAFNMQCAQVTSGAGTSLQTSNVLGNFVGTGASFATWQYVPLTSSGVPVVLSLSGVETLQMTGDTNENANFFTLVPAPAPINTNAATVNFAFTITGGGGGGSQTFNFSWAPDHLGWQLYTNSVGLTAAGSWFPVPGSAAVSNESITISPSKTNVFFQLRYP
jgi:hypothetical protein